MHKLQYGVGMCILQSCDCESNLHNLCVVIKTMFPTTAMGEKYSVNHH